MSAHPKTIIFLTCDAYGVIPPVSKLTPEQAMYHFISGYTAKVAGTERGVTEPTATFSPCFGGPFLTLHPLKYAELLREKMNHHNVPAYLVNTGWVGQSAKSGAKRISLPMTRKIIYAILEFCPFFIGWVPLNKLLILNFLILNFEKRLNDNFETEIKSIFEVLIIFLIFWSGKLLLIGT